MGDYLRKGSVTGVVYPGGTTFESEGMNIIPCYSLEKIKANVRVGWGGSDHKGINAE